MATVETFIAASPAQVFAVLADGWLYSNWVVGTSHMRAVDPSWPDVGSRLHHASGIWPLTLRDESEVIAMTPDQSLTLTVKGRPFGEARVQMRLVTEGAGTCVTMVETPTRGPGKWLHNPVSEKLLVRRNIEALNRLLAIAERHSSPKQ
jgi:Polyketide cyclase / dehydrase and lipid transport